VPNVEYTQDGFVATITINRPEALNALNRDVLAGLDEAVRRAEVERPRVVLLTGAGERAFVAGADIAEMATMSPDEGRRFSETGNAVFRRLERLPMPTIAVIHGFALGGGCELALACDIRLASTKAQFGQPEVSLGITPGFGGTQRLPRLVGVGIAKELIFAGRNIDAARALAIGLVNAVYPPDELRAAAERLAGDIASRAPIAVRAAKAAIDLGGATDLDAGLALEARFFGSTCGTADQREGMAAFTAKRKPAPYEDK